MVPAFIISSSASAYPVYVRMLFSHTRGKRQGWNYTHNEDAHTAPQRAAKLALEEGGKEHFSSNFERKVFLSIYLHLSPFVNLGKSVSKGTINFYNLCSCVPWQFRI